MSGDIDELRAVRIKIFKRDQAMIAEETALTMMINMGLNMAKYQAKQVLDIPQIGYPTIKKWTGLTLLKPAITIYDGFVVISTDLDVQAAEKGCDILTAPSFDTSGAGLQKNTIDVEEVVGDDNVDMEDL